MAQGFTQVPGLDFQEVYQAVANDITFRVMMVTLMLKKYHFLLFDVETAFLHGDLDTDIYMDCPKGMMAKPDDALLLVKTIYGLIQSPRRYYLHYKSVLEKLGFEVCPCDPCLFKRQNHLGICFITCYVDDNLCIGDKAAIWSVMEELPKNGLNVTVTENLDDYLSCEVIMNDAKDTAWIGQPHMVKKLRQKFGDMVKGMKTYQAPGTPGQGLVLAKDEDSKIDGERHALYRTCVGSLLYCIKHSRPEISNAVREFSKCLSGPNEAAFKEMLRVIKYVLDTPDIGLKLQPVKSEEWFIKVYSDSDWAGDKDSRKSVSGYMVFLNGALVCWRSKSQHCISLSSSEAEMYALTEAVKEIPFLVQVLLFIGVKIKLPVQVKVDNMGAIYMSENSAPSARTRHADIRQKFTADLQDKGLIKIDFVRSEDNTSDILTKNVTVELFERHTKHLVVRKDEVDPKSTKVPVRKGVGGVTVPLAQDLPQESREAAGIQSSHEEQWCQPKNIKNTSLTPPLTPPGRLDSSLG